ncbi:MAG: efflux RND transporter periplasmic adaptor subunit [Chlorobiales bacterium]|nr:efflux RND transporter periplasmic adaptor subunit [Chlorobiales bacterium]
MVLSKTQRIAGVSFAAVALILFFVFKPSALPVDSGDVQRGPLEITLDAEGVTRVNDRFIIAAPVTGKLVRTKFEEGDSVRKGMMVAAILPPELNTREYREASAKAASARAVYDEAIARERRAMLNFAQAERHSGRYRRLYSEGAVSKEVFEVADNETGVLKKEVEAARSGVKGAQFNFEALQAMVDGKISGKPVSVVSPVDGRILKIHEKSERVINAGSPIVDIGDPSAIEIVLDVLSSDAVRVQPGNRVVIRDWGGEKELQGAVKTIDPAAFTKISALGIEEKRVNIIAVLKEYEPLLGDNFRIQAKIVLREAAHVLQVPVSSLFRGKDEWHLFVIENGKAVERKVKLGMRGTFQAEVLAGVKEGEKVVVHPTNVLTNGMRVKAQE